MIKKLCLFSLLILFPVWSYSQSLTTVSGTITDAGGQTWNNGQVIAYFYQTPNTPGPFTNQGHAIQGGGTVSATMNGSGSFSMTLDDNVLGVTPANSKWQFVVCPLSTFHCIYTTPMTITGSSMNVSTTLSNQIPSINLQLLSTLSYAYSDAEVNTGFGGMYVRTTDQTFRQCATLTGCNGTGFTSISAANWGQPGAIGSITPNTGVFTTLQTNNAFSFNNGGSLGGNITGNPAFTGNPTIPGTLVASSFNNIKYVDGVTYTTVQAAMNALSSTGGTVMLACNTTYPGPTTFYSGIRLQSLCPKTYNTTLSYSSSQTINVTEIALDGIGFNMSGTAALTLDGNQQSRFNIFVLCSTATVCVTLSANTRNASSNYFEYLAVTTGGTTGVRCVGGTGTWTINNINDLVITMTATGTVTEAFGIEGNCDSNIVNSIHIFPSYSVGNGVVFNDSGSPTIDTDADNWHIDNLDFTFAQSITGTAITVNRSVGNVWYEGFGATGFSTVITADSNTHFERHVVDGSTGLYFGVSGIYSPPGTPANPVSLPNATGTISLGKLITCGNTSSCAGTIQSNFITAVGAVALASGSVTVTNLPFTSTTSYNCTATDNTATNVAKISNISASTMTITGTGTDVISYTCMGF